MLSPSLIPIVLALPSTLLTVTTAQAQPHSRPLALSGGCIGSRDGSTFGAYACITIVWLSNSNSTITLNVTDTALDHNGVYGYYSLYYDNDTVSTQEFTILNTEGWGTWEADVKDWDGDGRTLREVGLDACIWDVEAGSRGVCAEGMRLMRPL